MTTVLVANRGEIARRVFRTCRRLGLRTVAVYSDADANEPFTREADRAVRLGPAAASESYLSVERIVAAAHEARADLVHPGYGFLSEDPRLARALAGAGLTFVGPPPEVLAALGSKAEAKRIAARAAVPLLPGYDGEDQRDAALAAAARDVGYPVIVKPSAGGGGKGMLVARSAAELPDILAASRRVARAAFGDDRLVLERYLSSPRHVEVQLVGDGRGTLVALGERDCSAQRRHQKVLEEAPAPSFDDARRRALHDAALALGRAVGYASAGTAEFVVDETGAFFFLEVNARLQVEHPVTELVFGADLVEQQLRVAMGERLTLGEPRPRGHAVEVRLYAEDPSEGFLPSTGRVAHVRWPDGIRVDAGVEEGSVVTRFYDPLLAKLVAHGADRASALDALAAALERTAVLGVRTNLAFLRALVAHPTTRAGRVTTDLIERDLARLAPPAAAAPQEAFDVAGAALLAATRARASARDPWEALGAWRLGGPAAVPFALRDGGRERVVRVAGEGPYRVGARVVAREPEPHEWSLAGEPASAAVDGGAVWAGWRGGTWRLEAGPRERPISAIAGPDVTAPLPGVVVSVGARSGERVARGATLVVVEAMKMELPVRAPADGTVRAVYVSAGDSVDRGQRLVEFEAAAE